MYRRGLGKLARYYLVNSLFFEPRQLFYSAQACCRNGKDSKYVTEICEKKTNKKNKENKPEKG